MSFTQTRIYSDQNGTSNANVDVGLFFVDTSNNQWINGVKTFSSLPISTAVPTTSNQFVNQSYAYNRAFTTGAANINSIVKNISTYNDTYTYTYNGSLYTNNLYGVNTVILPKKATILQSNVLVTTNYPSSSDRIYSFGSGVSNSGNNGIWVGIPIQNYVNTIAYSCDGFNWTGLGATIGLNVGHNFYENIASNDTMVILPGAGGYAMTYSYDGINWINVSSGAVIGGTYCVAWGGDKWLVSTTSTTIPLAYSYDGINWTGISPIAYATAHIYTNGYMWFVMTTTGAAATTFYSYNGITWTLFPFTGSGLTTLGTMGWNGYMWVSLGTPIAYSYNGFFWISATIIRGIAAAQPRISMVTWGGNMWIAIAGNGIAYSFNGITWNAIQQMIGRTMNAQCTYVKYNGFMWMLGGVANAFYSYDGFTWSPLVQIMNGTGGYSPAQNPYSVFLNGPACVHWFGLRRNGMLYLPQTRTLALGASTGGTIAYSYAGSNNPVYETPPTIYNVLGSGSYYNNWSWGITNFGGSTNTLFSQANTAAWNGYQWICVGNPVPGSVLGNTIAYSSIRNGNIFYTDSTTGKSVNSNKWGNAGNVWTGLNNYTFSTAGNGIGWNGNVWVACGQGGNSLAYSPNGFSWFGLGTTIFSTAGQSVTWNGNLWIATGIGVGNTMAYSYDGVIWTGLGNQVFTVQANSATWNGYLWLAAGQGGNTLAFSWDSIAWIGLGTSIFSVSGNSVATNTANSMWVAAGTGTTNTLAYSTDGISWTGSGKSVFDVKGVSVTWNGKLWVAAGEAINTLAYSPDGVNWTGEGTTVFSAKGMGVVANMGVGTAIIPTNYTALSNATNPVWVIGGYGSYTMAYSTDAVTWNNVGTNVFSTVCYSVTYAYNGLWVATGGGSLNTIAYSTDGITWIGCGNQIFTNYAQNAAWNGIMWVATGSGMTNTLGYSYDGINWRGAGSTVFSINGYGIAWNGWMWIATGFGVINTMAYSYDGINWIGLGTTIFNQKCFSIAWNGTIWVSVGQGTGNTMAYSYNGFTWIGMRTSTFTSYGTGIAWNGSVWIAAGTGGNALAYSYLGTALWNAVSYNTVGNSVPLFNSGSAVTWNGQIWMAAGTGTNNLLYSINGNVWFPISNPINTVYAVGYSNYFTNKIVLDNNGYGPSGNQNLDIVPEFFWEQPGTYNQMNYTFKLTYP